MRRSAQSDGVHDQDREPAAVGAGRSALADAGAQAMPIDRRQAAKEEEGRERPSVIDAAEPRGERERAAGRQPTIADRRPEPFQPDPPEGRFNPFAEKAAADGEGPATETQA